MIQQFKKTITPDPEYPVALLVFILGLQVVPQ